MVKKSNKLKYKFSEKYKSYIRKCRHNTFNIAEGGVRAGKTINNVFAFAMELETTPDKIHLATGYKTGNAKLNIGEANGYGLEHIFRGRCRWGKFKDNECLYVNTATGPKMVIFAGAGMADSFKSIRGNSYGLWTATEINNHHETMIQECFNRSLMAKNRKIFWDLNPNSPKHWIYTKYIDIYSSVPDNGASIGGYNYLHATLFDNINLSENRRKSVMEEYDISSLRYKRDILGQRMAAEGLIYEHFANNPSDYLVSLEDIPRDLVISIGVDFGGNKSKHTFVATGRTQDYSKLYILSSKVVDTGITSSMIGEKYVDFLQSIENIYGRVSYTYADSAAQTDILSLKEALRIRGLERVVRNSQKGDINTRIKVTLDLMASGRLKYTEQAETVKLALCEAVWEETEDGSDKRLDNGTTDIDSLDAFEYSFSKDLKRYVRHL